MKSLSAFAENHGRKSVGECEAISASAGFRSRRSVRRRYSERKLWEASWKQWVNIAQRIGNFQFGVIFSALYFIVFIPIGILARLFSNFPKIMEGQGWKEMKDVPVTLDELKSQ